MSLGMRSGESYHETVLLHSLNQQDWSVKTCMLLEICYSQIADAYYYDSHCEVEYNNVAKRPFFDLVNHLAPESDWQLI